MSDPNNHPSPRVGDGIERAALRHRYGDNIFYLGEGLPLIQMTAAHETDVQAGEVGPGQRRHAAVVLEGIEREILTLPVEPRRSVGHDMPADEREDAAFLLPGDEREEGVWGHGPRHVVELWRGVCPEAPDWLSELWAGEWATAHLKDSSALSTPYEEALLGLLWFAWNTLTPPEWEVAPAPLLPLAQPLAPAGLVLDNLDGRSMEQRRVKAQTDADDPSAFWAHRAYDVAWFTGQRPHPSDRRFLPPGQEPDESKRASSGPQIYEPSDELPGGWVPTFQSVVIVEVNTLALWRIAWVSSQWPELLGLGLRLMTAEALPQLVTAIVGKGYRHEALGASWRFGLVDDATEPMDLGSLIGTSACDRCSSWFWAEEPNGATMWVDHTPGVPGRYEWTGPSLQIAQHACYCCDEEDGRYNEETHDEEREYDACPYCEQEAAAHDQRPSDRLVQPRLSALIWEGTGEPPAWLKIQATEGKVPLLLATQIPQAHVRGLRLHHRDNTQRKDSQ